MTQPSCHLCECSQSIILFRKGRYNFCHCSECGLIYLYPQPEECEDTYNMDYYSDRSILRETPARIIMHTRHLELMESYVTYCSLLDIGCGTGYFMDLACSRGWKVEGVDISCDAINYAGDHYGLNVRNCDLAELPKHAYSAITLWDVLEHLNDPSGLLSEIHQLLKHNGIMAISTPNVYGISTRITGRYSSIFNTKDHLFYFSDDTLRKTIEKSGFRVVKMLTETIYARNIAKVISRVIMKELYHEIQNVMQNDFLLHFISVVDIFLRLSGIGDQITVFARIR